MTGQPLTLEQIKQHSLELRRLHTQCTGRQKIAIVAERLREPECLSNKVVLVYSAIEALGRFILIKRAINPETSATYKKFQKCTLMEIINKVRSIYPLYFSTEEVGMLISDTSTFSEVRNYLTHEFAFISGHMATELLDCAQQLLNIFTRIITEEKL